MKCTFNYNGKIFNSELELDDFLLSHGHELYSKYGDIVFSKSVPQQNVMHAIESHIDEGSKRLAEKFHLDKDSMSGHMDIEYEKVDPPYVAVTEFLRGCINPETGKLLFPDFAPDDITINGETLRGYFPRRYDDWKVGSFTTKEVNDFFDGDVTKTHRSFTEPECKEFRKILETKWQNQGRIGTEVHKILQQIFKTVHTKEGKTWELYKESEEKLYELINDNVDKNLLSNDNIKEVIHYGKKLYKYLEENIGEDLTFYPEYIIWGNYLDSEGNQKQILGKIDLLIVDKYGKVHIIDYKTSPEDYSLPVDTEGGYSSAKVQAFKYQLSAYNILSQMLGIGNSGTKVYVAPMQLQNFKRDDTGKWGFSGIKEYTGFIDELSANIQETAKIESVLKQYFINIGTPDDALDEILTKHNTQMSNWFNVVQKNDYTEEDINAIIQRRVKKNKATSEFEYRSGSGEIKTFKTEKDLRNWLERYLKYKKIEVENFTQKLADVIESTIDGENDPILFSTLLPKFEFEDGTSDWINKTLAKYYNGNYTVINNESAKKLQTMGIVLVKNNFTNAVDVITVSDKVLFGYNIQARGRKKITAKFSDDVTEENQSKGIFESTNGNIETIKTMLLLNQIPETLRGLAINEIRIINPVLGSGSWAPNEQIRDNFKRLNQLSEEKGLQLEKNNFEDGTIKFNDSYQQFVNEYNTIIQKHLAANDNVWKKFINGATTAFDKEITGFDNSIEVTADLNKLKEHMETIFPKLRELPEWDTTDDASLLYFRVNQAISYLTGVDYLQQFADSDKYLDSINIFKSGATGTRIDNPGKLKNENLNKAVKLTTDGYQNLRQELQQLKSELRQAIAALKKKEGFGYLSGRLYKNKVDLFKPLFRKVDNDILLVNPNTFNGSAEHKRVLELALKIFNKNRFPNKTEEQLKAMQDSDNLAYFRLPLTPGKMNSTVSVEGLMGALRSRLKFLLPNIAKQDAINREAGFEIESDKEQQELNNMLEENLNKTVDIPNHTIHRANIWKMTTMFDAGETETGRERLLTLYDEGYFEHDLETLILKHEFAYRQKDIMDRVLPLIKAGALNIQYQQLMQGHDYTEDIQYIKDYVKNKIFNKSLVEDKYKAITAYKSGVMRGASALALGFNPKQFYQVVEGLWKDIKMVITKPDGKYNFSSKDMFRAFKEVMGEMFHYGDEKSLLELVNEFYALNDMDMHPDVYVEKLLDDKSLMYNFQTVMFRFTSRPDFYNRMAIFRAHMIADGCADAHYKKNGMLIYDWKLDKRFDEVSKLIESGKTVDEIKVIAKNKNDKGKLAEQLGLYVKYVEQMAQEGTTVIDKVSGQKRLIRKGDILPKAYTTNQSEAYKSISDMLYGYYAHEKKALIQSELIGSLMLQMYTYWSGKKNQYLQSSGVKTNGHFEQLVVDGIPYYMDENGNPTKTNTGIAYIRWNGRFEEGILLTLNHMRELIQLGVQEYDKGLIGGLSKGIETMKLNMFKEVPEDLKQAYVHNLRAISYDLSVWLLIGQLVFRSVQNDVKEYINENEADNLAQAITNNSLSLGASLLKTSVMDFNFLESIGGRGIDWTPFSISMMTNTYNNWRNFLTGSQSLKKTVEKSTSATRQIHEVFDYIWKDPEE